VGTDGVRHEVGLKRPCEERGAGACGARHGITCSARRVPVTVQGASFFFRKVRGARRRGAREACRSRPDGRPFVLTGALPLQICSGF